MRVGFVGLGLMGTPIARNILRAGHDLVVYSRNAERARELMQDGAIAVDSIAALVDDVEVVCGCRVTPQDSIDLFIGRGGAVDSRRRSLLCIDFATIDPATARGIAARLAEKGHGFLDAPVSGGPNGAAAGTLSIMAGGSEADFRRAKPLLDPLGKSVVHVGPSGAGTVAKLCNNMITGTLHVLIAEAMVLGTKAGIDCYLLYQVLHASTARSTTLERVVPNHFLARNFTAASALTTIIKDLECISATAKELGVRLLLPNIAQQCFIEAAALGHGDKDLSAVILPMEEIAGIKVGRG